MRRRLFSLPPRDAEDGPVLHGLGLPLETVQAAPETIELLDCALGDRVSIGAKSNLVTSTELAGHQLSIQLTLNVAIMYRVGAPCLDYP